MSLIDTSVEALTDVPARPVATPYSTTQNWLARFDVESSQTSTE
jgi:hypothetical protein